MEVDLGGFQETILEIVQVEEHTVLIELRLRITVREIKADGTTYLYVRQLTDSPAQQFLFFQRVSSSCLTTTTHGIEKRQRSEVCL